MNQQTTSVILTLDQVPKSTGGVRYAEAGYDPKDVNATILGRIYISQPHALALGEAAGNVAFPRRVRVTIEVME